MPFIVLEKVILMDTHIKKYLTVWTSATSRQTEQHNQMIDQDMNLEHDFLQLGHHGSDTSTSQSFLDEVKPTYAIYSAGEGNTYGHPHQEVLDRLDAGNINTYGTDVHGNIVVTT